MVPIANKHLERKVQVSKQTSFSDMSEDGRAGISQGGSGDQEIKAAQGGDRTTKVG